MHDHTNSSADDARRLTQQTKKTNAQKTVKYVRFKTVTFRQQTPLQRSLTPYHLLAITD